MMSESEAVQSMVLSFRLTELQRLMGYAGKSKGGRKSDLQARALELAKANLPDFKLKILELYKAQNPQSSTNNNSIRSGGGGGGFNSQSPATQQPQPNRTSQIDVQPQVYQQHQQLVYPPFPDVKLLKLPFYKIEATLMKPSSLQPQGNARFQEQTFSFHLTPQQANAISQSSFRDSSGKLEYRCQLQMRFSLLETSCEQDDNFPSSICVKVNNRLQPLPNPIPTNKPGVEPKRPPKPINITGLCQLSATQANYLNVSWAVEIGKGFCVSVYYVDKLSSDDLLNHLRNRGHRSKEYTIAVIKDKLNDKDSDIATTSCKVSLACPLGKMRMRYPCRASTCSHLQCFDASLYLSMNERKPKWLCPVCNQMAPYENLLIDGYFTDVLNSKRLPEEDHEIVLSNDASWAPLPSKKKEGSGSSGDDRGYKQTQPQPEPEAPKPKDEKQHETFNLSDDEDEDSVESAEGAASPDQISPDSALDPDVAAAPAEMAVPADTTAPAEAAAATSPGLEQVPKETITITLDSDDDDDEPPAATEGAHEPASPTAIHHRHDSSDDPESPPPVAKRTRQHSSGSLSPSPSQTPPHAEDSPTSVLPGSPDAIMPDVQTEEAVEQESNNATTAAAAQEESKVDGEEEEDNAAAAAATLNKPDEPQPESDTDKNESIICIDDD